MITSREDFEIGRQLKSWELGVIDAIKECCVTYQAVSRRNMFFFPVLFFFMACRCELYTSGVYACMRMIVITSNPKKSLRPIRTKETFVRN